ncbi:MAG TPA: hypothetical protein VMT46_04950 [Anaerolineaceae bacterium]|nr:hypothetical protein [Anaerolineaceae bacterium]
MKTLRGYRSNIITAVIIAAIALTGCGQGAGGGPTVATLPPTVEPPTMEPTLPPLPTEEPSPTPTEAPTIEPSQTPAPTAIPTAAPLEFSGKGNGKVALTGYSGNGAFLHATHDGISTFHVVECDAQGKQTIGIIETASRYDGIKLMDVVNPTFRAENLCVTADGNWTLAIYSLKDYAKLPSLAVPGKARGQVSQIFHLEGDATMLTMSYTGGRVNLPAYVELYALSDSSVSVIASLGAGDFGGQAFSLLPGTRAIAIDADYGSWSILIQ